MEPTDFTAPEDTPAADLQTARFTLATFQGIPLWPYTPGTRSAFNQACEPEDLVSFRDLAFCFVHVKRGGPTVYADMMALQPLLMNGALLRVAIAEWEDQLSGGDFEKADAVLAEAKTIREAALKLVEKTAITARSDNPLGQKPSGAAPLTTPVSTKDSSQPSSGLIPTTPPGN